MTLSFLWWLPIVKAPYVKKKWLARYECVAVNFSFQIFLLFSFLLNSLAYPTIPKNNEKIRINCNKYITDWSRIYLRLAFLVKGRKKIGTELINCGEGKKSEIKYTVRERKANVANWISFKVYRGWIKMKSKHKILKEKDTNKDKKILTSKSRFRGTLILWGSISERFICSI